MGSIVDAINKAVQDLRKRNMDKPSPFRYFWAGGTGIPDEMAVEYFKDNPSVIVVTRDGKEWRCGKEVA